MAAENKRHKLRLKIIEETTTYFAKEVEQNKLMGKNYKKICMTLNYIERFLILASAVTGCISIYAFASVFGLPIGIISYAS